MKQLFLSVGLILGLLVLGVACDYGKSGGGTATADSALMSPAGSAGRTDNDEGVGHYKQGHWDVAEGHFRKAMKADPNLAEAHYNLGLALDKMGKHDEATAEFKKAAELAPTNAAIKDSPILKKHIAM
ncbi:MAG: tetratricopeptide repeat protein [Nitrospirae bacterium]|nr:MAG: tetratricopeptide repeat protein [Nitrospirota bacterium]